MQAELTGNHDYDVLPQAVKDIYSLTQWLWLSDAEKGRVVQTECEPETEL